MYRVKHTVLSSRVSRVGRVSRVSAMVSVRFSGMFNMVQEFGTAVYRIASFIMYVKTGAILQKWVPYSQRYLVLGLVGLGLPLL